MHTKKTVEMYQSGCWEPSENAVLVFYLPFCRMSHMNQRWHETIPTCGHPLFPTAFQAALDVLASARMIMAAVECLMRAITVWLDTKWYFFFSVNDDVKIKTWKREVSLKA